MANRTFTLFIALSLISIITYSQKREIAVSEPVMIDKSYSLYVAGDVFLAGQPTTGNLDSLIDAGVTLVVNLRTEEEMNHLDYDQTEYLESKGIQYIHIPMGGAAGYDPKGIQKMGEKITASDGKVLIHCRGAGRATYAWMAWLINFENYSIDEAVELGSKARFAVPFFDLLGYPVTIQKE